MALILNSAVNVFHKKVTTDEKCFNFRYLDSRSLFTVFSRILPTGFPGLFENNPRLPP